MTMPDLDITEADVAAMSGEQLAYVLPRLREMALRERRRRFYRYFPETGPLRRVLYARHMEFFEAGATYSERCFMAANRVGKTESGGGFEVTSHLTGEYRPWWSGHRFKRPIRSWIAGDTNETTRDILQKKMLGEITWSKGRKTVDGTGMIPGDLLGPVTWKQGVADLIDTIKVRHVPTDGWSTLGIKSYAQGRKSFQGTEQDVIWLDEEPPADVYSECLTRLMTTSGLMMLTFTPLSGLSDVVMGFMPSDMRPAAT